MIGKVLWALARKIDEGYDIQEFNSEEEARNAYNAISHNSYMREEYYLFQVKAKKAFGADLGEHYDIEYE